MYTSGSVTYKITVEAVDITAYVPISSIRINQEYANIITTAQFVVENGSALGLREMDEISITDSSGSTIYFGGYLTSVDYVVDGVDVNLRVDCQDYTILLDKSTINMIYDGYTDDEIVPLIRTDADPALTDFDFSTYVFGVTDVSTIKFIRMTAREALDKLAAMVGINYMVDYSKNLRWNTSTIWTAAYSVSDSPNYTTSYPCQNLKQLRDGMDIVNKIEVVGGNIQSVDMTLYFAGTANSPEITLPYFMHPPSTGSILIWRNDGTETVPVWTAMTVLLGGIDELSASTDVLFYFTEKRLVQIDNWQTISNAVKITCKIEVPLRLTVQSDSSYATYGRWFKRVISEPSITSYAEGVDFGNAKLLEYASKEVLEFDINEPGLKPGMIITVVNSKLSINDTFIIRKVSMTFLGGGFINYHIVLGDYIPDLYALLLEINRKTQQYDEGATLDKLISTEEELDVAETTYSPTATKGSYKWGATGGSPLKWDFSTWA